MHVLEITLSALTTIFTEKEDAKSDQGKIPPDDLTGKLGCPVDVPCAPHFATWACGLCLKRMQKPTWSGCANKTPSHQSEYR